MHMHKFVVDFLCFLLSQEVLFGFAIINKGSYRQEYQITGQLQSKCGICQVFFKVCMLQDGNYCYTVNTSQSRKR